MLGVTIHAWLAPSEPHSPLVTQAPSCPPPKHAHRLALNLVQRAPLVARGVQLQSQMRGGRLAGCSSSRRRPGVLGAVVAEAAQAHQTLNAPLPAAPRQPCACGGPQGQQQQPDAPSPALASRGSNHQRWDGEGPVAAAARSTDGGSGDEEDEASEREEEEELEEQEEEGRAAATLAHHHPAKFEVGGPPAQHHPGTEGHHHHRHARARLGGGSSRHHQSSTSVLQMLPGSSTASTSRAGSAASSGQGDAVTVAAAAAAGVAVLEDACLGLTAQPSPSPAPVAPLALPSSSSSPPGQGAPQGPGSSREPTLPPQDLSGGSSSSSSSSSEGGSPAPMSTTPDMYGCGADEPSSEDPSVAGEASQYLEPAGGSRQQQQQSAREGPLRAGGVRQSVA